jgi:hypothetical protein
MGGVRVFGQISDIDGRDRWQMMQNIIRNPFFRSGQVILQSQLID